MKTDLRRFSGIALLIAAGTLFLSSCIGPAGPPGQDGEDGLDAVGTCNICHNNDILIVARQKEMQYSLHFTGETYERSSKDCAPCHTHQGFMLTYMGDGIEAPFDIDHPTPFTCRTCHLIHVNYNESDWQLVTISPVVMAHTGAVVDLGDPSNVCIKCHQSRPVDPMPEPGGFVDVYSSRYGPHHGPQANNVWGVGGWEPEGSMGYPSPGSSPHASVSVGCVRCHMAPVPFGGNESGGHTFNMSYLYREADEYNVGACTACHPELQELGSFDLNGVQSRTRDLMSTLENYFISRGWMDGPGELFNAPIEGLSEKEVGAMLNYRTILEDGSYGIHNPGYMTALLVNAIEALGI